LFAPQSRVGRVFRNLSGRAREFRTKRPPRSGFTANYFAMSTVADCLCQRPAVDVQAQADRDWRIWGPEKVEEERKPPNRGGIYELHPVCIERAASVVCRACTLHGVRLLRNYPASGGTELTE
jgi:hypothetical protein